MAKRKTKPKLKTAARLLSGKYSWRGRAVPFAKLPKGAKHQLQTKWAKKSAKTRAKFARAAKRQGVSKEFLDLVSDKKRAKTKHKREEWRWQVRVGARRVLPLVKAIKAKLYREFPAVKAGTWSMHLAWPDDPRSGPGRPFITFAGFEPTPMTKGLSFKDRDFARQVEEIRDTNGAQLDRSKRVSSGAAGRVKVLSIHLLAW